jgi:hypothetical protein
MSTTTSPSTLDRVPDEILLRITCIAAEADHLDDRIPLVLNTMDLDSPPLLAPTASALSEACARWNAVIQGKSNEPLWHFGVLLDLRGIYQVCDYFDLSRFNHRLFISKGYSIHGGFRFSDEPTIHAPPSAVAHLGAIASYLLRPYRSRITSFYLEGCVPLLNPHTLGRNSYSRLQKLSITYGRLEFSERAALDPHDIVSFLYSPNSASTPLKYASHLGSYGIIPRTWSHLPTGPSIRELVIIHCKDPNFLSGYYSSR